MRDLLGQAWTLARKDLILEFRTRTALLSAVVFTALVLTVFNFGRDPTAVATIDLAPSILWVTFTFAAMLALNRAFQLELENGALEGLLVSPVSRRSLYLGKLLANLGFVGVVEAVGLPLFVLFFEDRKSTRLNSSHRTISYAVFCLKKKNKLVSTIS